MRARIIAKNHIVSKVITDVLVNGRKQKFTEYHVTDKPVKAHSNRADRIVFRAIHLAGTHNWADVHNQLDNVSDSRVMNALDKEIARHTTF